MLKATTVIILFSVVFFTTQAQKNTDKILLMTGKTLEGSVTSSDSASLYYTFVKKSGKEKEQKLDLERVFSVTNEQDVEEVYYVMDTLVGDYFSEQEMRDYIDGERDAANYSHSNWTIAAGVPITAAAGFFLSSTILVFPVPFAYTVAAALPPYKLKGEKGVKPSKAGSPAYVLGYEREARTKRVFKSLIAGLVGTASGFALGLSQQ
jgi:hypothetical protein